MALDTVHFCELSTLPTSPIYPQESCWKVAWPEYIPTDTLLDGRVR